MLQIRFSERLQSKIQQLSEENEHLLVHIGSVTAMNGLVRPMKHALVQAAEQDSAAFRRERACRCFFFLQTDKTSSCALCVLCWCGFSLKRF
jgi:hypothetical protein